MAADIEREFGWKSRLVGGHGGVFEVRLDGEPAYVKSGGGCGVPPSEDVLDALRAKA